MLPMDSSTQWISERDVASVLNLADAVQALARGFSEEGAGRAVALEKTMVGFDGHSTLHALGAAFGDERLVGAKTWAHTPGGADPVLLLFDADTGALRAVIEAFALGQLRTAGTAALATDRLASADASQMAIVGTGKQAMGQVAAVASVRCLAGVRAFSRDPERRREFARRVTDELGLPCATSSSVTEAVDGADVVTLVTRATEPVLQEEMLPLGVHINAVGAIDLQRREFEPKILARCASVVTDSQAQARHLSSELREFYGAGPDPWDGVRSLGDVVRGESTGRDSEDITLFKGMGSGIEDLSLGAELLSRVGAKSLNIPRGGRASIDLVGPPSMKKGGQEP